MAANGPQPRSTPPPHTTLPKPLPTPSTHRPPPRGGRYLLFQHKTRGLRRETDHWILVEVLGGHLGKEVVGDDRHFTTDLIRNYSERQPLLTNKLNNYPHRQSHILSLKTLDDQLARHIALHQQLGDPSFNMEVLYYDERQNRGRRLQGFMILSLNVTREFFVSPVHHSLSQCRGFQETPSFARPSTSFHFEPYANFTVHNSFPLCFIC